jgi:hypothetical protein|nr:MAG TPA: hypothetical protein [Bacteriophage sp.]
MLDINKQSMKYSQQGARITIYERDDDGNIKYYIDSDGNKIPLIAEEKVGFSKPVNFRANIAFSGGEAKTEEFGFDAADYDAIMLTDKNEFPLKKGDLIWLDSEVTYIDEDTEIVDETSADFTVVGVKPALKSTKYVLKAVVK